ncbi:MAG TPA: TRAP transporter small permease [Burkholderiaceae bacterium]|nr:TRAP transporter small permease [Burkholderiaceae bacterium]
MSVLARFNALSARAVRALVVIMVLVMTCALALQVGLRYIMNITLSWSEELSLGLFTWTVLLSSALGVHEGFHVRMALVLDTLPKRSRRESERLIHLATVAVGVFLAWAGWRYVADTRGSVSAAIGYPIELLHASAFVCGVLIAFYALESALIGRVDEPPPIDPERV